MKWRFRIGLLTLLLFSLSLAAGGLLWLRWAPWQAVMHSQPQPGFAINYIAPSRWSPDGERLLFVQNKVVETDPGGKPDAATVQIWNGRTGWIEREWKATYAIIPGKGGGCLMEWSATGRWVVLQSRRTDVPNWMELYETATGKPRASHPLQNSRILAFSPDDRSLVMRNDKKDITQLLDIEAETALDLPEGIEACVFSPDGKYIAAALPFSAVLLFEIQAKQALWIKPLLSKAGRETLIDVASMGFSPDSKWLAASTGVPHETVVYEIPGGRQQCRVLGVTSEYDIEGGVIKSSSFSPDNKRFATVGGGSGMIWDLSTGQLLHDMDFGMRGAPILEFSADGQFIRGLRDIWRSDNYELLPEAERDRRVPLAHRYNYSRDYTRKAEWDSPATGVMSVYQLRRPYEWYGFAWLPEFWLTLVLAAAFVFHLLRRP